MKKQNNFSSFALGAVLGGIAGCIVGAVTRPRLELDERDELEAEGKKILKSTEKSKKTTKKDDKTKPASKTVKTKK